MEGLSEASQAPPKLGKSSGASKPSQAHTKLAGDDYRDELIHIFDIPKHLLRDAHDQGGVKLYYEKYKACIQAISTAVNMEKTGEWVIRRPTETEIVHLFIGKTMWHDHFTKVFPKVPKYPEMQKWLNGHEDAMSTFDIWGREKPHLILQN